MKNKLKIGITYDVKEDYSFKSDDWKHTDFSTLAEVNYVKSLFEQLGHTVYLIGNYERLNIALKTNTLPPIDIVFNTAEGVGSRNREGWIPSLLEINNIPYSGSDAYGLSLSLSKVHTKLIAEHLGIRTPEYYEINRPKDSMQAATRLPGPWVIKPNYEGSSSGVIFVDSEHELSIMAEQLLAQYQQTILCETYIGGQEVNTSVLYDGDATKVIGTVEVVRINGSPLGVFDAKDKFTSTCTKILAHFPIETMDELANSTVRLHQALGCLDYNRADFRVDENGHAYLLELNPLPSLDEESGFAKCCEYAGLKLGLVLEHVLFNALARYKKDSTYSKKRTVKK